MSAGFADIARRAAWTYVNSRSHFLTYMENKICSKENSIARTSNYLPEKKTLKGMMNAETRSMFVPFSSVFILRFSRSLCRFNDSKQLI